MGTLSINSGDNTCDVSLSDLEQVPFNRILRPPTDATCDVSLRELEVVPPPLPQTSSSAPARTDWLSVDRTFLSAVVGTCLLMVGAVVMVLIGLKSPETVEEVAPKPSVMAAAVDPAALKPAPNIQAEADKKPALRPNRKVRKVTAKVPAKGKVTTRKSNLKRTSLASR